MSDPTTTRHDGWTAPRQHLFLKSFARCRSVTAAAACAGMARESAYRFRRRHPASLFTLTWSEIERAAKPPMQRSRPTPRTVTFAQAMRQGHLSEGHEPDDPGNIFPSWLGS